MVEVHYLGEGPTDSAIAARIILAAGGRPGRDFLDPTNRRGKTAVDRRLFGLNKLAARQPVLVLRDLDMDARCGVDLAEKLLREPAERMCFRIAVHSADAWLLADCDAFADWLGIPATAITRNPEELRQPKQEILSLAKRSRRRKLKAALLPRTGSGIQYGPDFHTSLAEFARTHWDPLRAAETNRSPSLGKAIMRLRSIVRG